MPGSYYREAIVSKIEALFLQAYRQHYGDLPPETAILLPGSLLKPQFSQFAARDPKILDEIFDDSDSSDLMYDVDMVAARILYYNAEHDRRDSGNATRRDQDEDQVPTDNEDQNGDYLAQVNPQSEYHARFPPTPNDEIPLYGKGGGAAKHTRSCKTACTRSNGG